MLMSELFRMINHLEYISNISGILDYDIARNLALLEKEKILRTTEIITGARVIPNYMRIGGVRANIQSDLLKKLKRLLPSMYKKIKKIEEKKKKLFPDFSFGIEDFPVKKYQYYKMGQDIPGYK